MSSTSAVAEESSRPSPSGGWRSEVGLIAALVGGLPLAGLLVQRWFPPGPVTAVAATVVLTAVLVVVAMVVRGRLLWTLSGFRHAAVVLSALGFASALGTLVLQNKPLDFYPERYGPLGRLITLLRFDDIFHSVWFAALLALMTTGLILSAVLRWPITRKNAGFFAVHLGTVVALAGAALSGLYATKGRIDLHVGGPSASAVTVTRNGVPTGEKEALGASVRLMDFDVERYPDRLRVVFYQPTAKGDYQPKAVYDKETGIAHRLPKGASFKVKSYFPDLVLRPNAVAAPGGVPALKAVVDGQEIWLAAGELTRVDRKDGKAALLFGTELPAVEAPASPHGLALGEAALRPVQVGETVALGEGVQVKVVRYLPHFNYNIEKREAFSASDQPVNPALEVEVNGQKRFLFGKMAGHMKSEGPQLRYVFSGEGAAGSLPETVVHVGPDGALTVRRGKVEEKQAFRAGLEVEGMKLAELLASARVEKVPGTASSEVRNPAVLVEVTENGATTQALLEAAEHSGMPAAGGALVFEAHQDDVKSFRSRVLVSEGESQREAVVAVNDPLSVGQWELYQSNYDPKDPSYSGLEAMRDPGVSWVFTGFGLMFFGVVYVVYAQPRLRKKKKEA